MANCKGKTTFLNRHDTGRFACSELHYMQIYLYRVGLKMSSFLYFINFHELHYRQKVFYAQYTKKGIENNVIITEGYPY